MHTCLDIFLVVRICRCKQLQRFALASIHKHSNKKHFLASHRLRPQFLLDSMISGLKHRPSQIYPALDKPKLMRPLGWFPCRFYSGVPYMVVLLYVSGWTADAVSCRQKVKLRIHRQFWAYMDKEFSLLSLTYACWLFLFHFALLFGEKDSS